MKNRPSQLLAGVTLVVVVAVGWNLADRWRPQLTPDGLNQELQEPLERLASGVPRVIGGDAIMPTASFVTAQGRYCREFEATTRAQKSRGAACRDGARRWTVAQAAGRRLTAEEERSAIERGWRKP